MVNNTNEDCPETRTTETTNNSNDVSNHQLTPVGAEQSVPDSSNSESSVSSFEVINSIDNQSSGNTDGENIRNNLDISGPSETTTPKHDLDPEVVSSKIQQIQHYIQQTTTALQNLEDNNKTDSDQYRTLVKVLKDLRSSETKLQEQLNLTKENDDKDTETGSARVGVVGSMNEPVNPMSMRERLARHEIEQNILSTRLRESVAKRQELIARYENTRERLNELKKQRRGLVQEERQLLQDQGAPENPYENAIPEAETWTIIEVERGIAEFQGLKEKVVSLQKLYTAQANTVNPEDSELKDRIFQKLAQVGTKERQVDDILVQLDVILQRKRDEAASGDESIEQVVDSPITNPEVSNQGADDGALQSGNDHVETSDESAISSKDTFVTTSGVVIELSDLQKTNPKILSTFEDLQKMKEKLATLENLSNILTNASKTPGAVTEILAQHNLQALITDEDDENDENQAVGQTPVQEIQNGGPAEFIPLKNDIASTTASKVKQSPMFPALNFNKNSLLVNSVNEGNGEQPNKSSMKTDHTNIFQPERFIKEVDEHVQMMQLQEEIRQKKNAMESLRTSMGKSSTFVPDMTDNISENISDHSDSERNPRFCIDPLMDNSQEAHSTTIGHDSWTLPTNQYKRRTPRGELQKNSLSSRISVNNLDSCDTPSVRPKQNRSTQNVTKQDYGSRLRNRSRQDTVYPSDYLNLKAKISEAADEISNMRDTVASLKSYLPQGNGLDYPMPLPPQNNSQYLLNNCNTARQSAMHYPPMPLPYQGSLDQKIHQLSNCLQQCLAMLELHSMEILSLNKQVQGIKSTVDPVRPFRPATIPNHVNRNINPVGISDRRPSYQEAPITSDTYPNHGLFNMSWDGMAGNADLMFENQNFYAPFEGYRPNNANEYADNGQMMPNPVPSTDWTAFQRQPSHILNNQVLPGTRANNYWDNFRSYSQQNPLSNNSKCNDRDRTACTMVRNGPLYLGNPKMRMPNGPHRDPQINPVSHASKRSAMKNTSIIHPAKSTCKETDGNAVRPDNVVKNNAYYTARNSYPEPLENIMWDIPRFHEDMHTTTTLKTPVEAPRLSLDEHNEIRSLQHSPCGSDGYAPDGEILAEVNKLLQSKKVKPQFLLNLFKELSVITQKSDQNFVLEFLRNMTAGKVSERIMSEQACASHNVTDNTMETSELQSVYCSPCVRNISPLCQRDTANVYVASDNEKVAQKLSVPSASFCSTGAKPKIMSPRFEGVQNDLPTDFKDRVANLSPVWSSGDHFSQHSLSALVKYARKEITRSCSYMSETGHNNKEILQNVLPRLLLRLDEHCTGMRYNPEYIVAVSKRLKKLVHKYFYKSAEQIRLELPDAIDELLKKIWPYYSVSSYSDDTNDSFVGATSVSSETISSKSSLYESNHSIPLNNKDSHPTINHYDSELVTSSDCASTVCSDVIRHSNEDLSNHSQGSCVDQPTVKENEDVDVDPPKDSLINDVTQSLEAEDGN